MTANLYSQAFSVLIFYISFRLCYLFFCNFGLLLVKTKGIPSNALTGSTTSQSLDDLVHVTGPITEDAIIKVLQQRSAMGENYVSIINRLYFYLF